MKSRQTFGSAAASTSPRSRRGDDANVCRCRCAHQRLSWNGLTALAAQAVIDDPDREFVVSDILRLELVPKPHYYGRTAEEQFYEAFFAAAIEYVETGSAIVQAAESEAKSFGLAAADALHVAAAKDAGVQEFITAEKSTSPVFRVTGLSITSIRF